MSNIQIMCTKISQQNTKIASSSNNYEMLIFTSINLFKKKNLQLQCNKDMEYINKQ
jgi:hypothetical protein